MLSLLKVVHYNHVPSFLRYHSSNIVSYGYIHHAQQWYCDFNSGGWGYAPHYNALAQMVQDHVPWAKVTWSVTNLGKNQFVVWSRTGSFPDANAMIITNRDPTTSRIKKIWSKTLSSLIVAQQNYLHTSLVEWEPVYIATIYGRDCSNPKPTNTFLSFSLVDMDICNNHTIAVTGMLIIAK